MKWWEIYSEAQYVQLRTVHQPKIFIWYAGKLPLSFRDRVATLLERLEEESKNAANFIVSVVHVDRDPGLQELFSFLKPTTAGPILTGYSPRGATLFKCDASSFHLLGVYFRGLLAFPQN